MICTFYVNEISVRKPFMYYVVTFEMLASCVKLTYIPVTSIINSNTANYITLQDTFSKKNSKLSILQMAICYVQTTVIINFISILMG